MVKSTQWTISQPNIFQKERGSGSKNASTKDQPAN